MTTRPSLPKASPPQNDEGVMLMTAEKLDKVPELRSMAAPEHVDVNLRWHVLFTEPTAELKAAKYLDRLGFKPYVPIETKNIHRSIRTMFGVQRRECQSVRPLFRGYLFVPLNRAWSFGPIYTTPSVRHAEWRIPP
jgi:hypothetical protein